MAKPPTDLGRIPGPVYIPNVAAVRLVWGLPTGKVISNVLHGTYTGTFAPSQAMANSLMSAILASTAWTPLASELMNSTTFTNVGIRDMAQINTTPPTGHVEFLSNTPGGNGTGGTNDLPPQTAYVVTLKSGTSGQSGRGRVYLGGFSVAVDAGAGVATGPVQAAAQNFVIACQTAMQTVAGLVMCIAHPARQQYTSPSTGRIIAARAPGSVQVVQIVAENLVWDTQRRRSYA